MLTFLLVLVVIGLLILVHEWGHFYCARRLGIKVEEFGFGFPPRLYSRIHKGVRYSLNLLPLGGFVKIFGEHGEGAHSKESFVARPVWQRFIVLAAGIGMNIVLAWIFFSASAAIGIPSSTDEQTSTIPVSIIAVIPNSPAEKAGLRFGDTILEMKSHAVSLRIESEKDVQDFTQAYRGEPITLTIKRGDEIKDIVATPRFATPDGEGPLGIGLGRLTITHVPLYQAPIEGGKTLIRSIVFTVEGLWYILTQLFTSGMKSVAVSGPVGVFFYARDTEALGLSYFLQFAGILSINLAVLNFLPIPALDGGRIFFLLLEKIKGRRLNPYIENTAHTIGFILLILLMIVVTYNDIARLF